MSFAPKNIFVGLIDFFSILLPGAVLTYLLRADLQRLFLRGPNPPFSEVEGWAVFLFSSYLIGHFVFLLGARVDDLYDVIRNAVDVSQISKLANGKNLSPSWARSLAWLVFRKEQNQAVNLALKMKEYYLNPFLGSSAINVFQWSKARLALESPEASAVVQRFEADSKFFRSLLVVLIILFFWGVVHGWPLITLLIIPLLILASFWRYMEQRLKATNQAYWFVITMEGRRENGFWQEVLAPEDGTTHAGGVVFRNKDGKVEYLLVQAKDKPEEWVLPKGHIEPGEKMPETAVREVREETGVLARVKGELDSIAFHAGEKLVKTRYYWMEAVGKGRPSDSNRKAEWLPFDKAVKQITHRESCELLNQAHQKLIAAV